MKAGHAKSRLIDDFWRWFRRESERLASLYERGQFDRLITQMNAQLNRLNPQLAWEIGPGKTKPHLLAISAEGNPELRLLADALVSMAPILRDWEIHSFKQARSAPAKIRLPERDTTVSTEKWRFMPSEDMGLGRIHLTVVDEVLSSMKRDVALRVVSLFLDASLGEEQVEEWLGRISVASPLDCRSKSYAIADLRDYLLWATHRDKNPLRKKT